MAKDRGKPQSRRSYSSPLRASQRDATRRAIAQAAYELLRLSPDELTVPAIAARAGVSVPTVNRHFGSRQALLEGVVAHIDSLADAGPPRVDLDPATYFGAGLEPLVRQLFGRFAAIGMPLGGSSTAAIMELRSKVTIPRRRRVTDDAIAKVLPGLAEPHRTWLSDLLVVLLSSSMVHTMQSYLGLSADESATRMHWLLSLLFAETQRMSAAAAGGPTGARPGPRARSTRASGSKRANRRRGDAS